MYIHVHLNIMYYDQESKLQGKPHPICYKVTSTCIQFLLHNKYNLKVNNQTHTCSN